MIKKYEEFKAELVESHNRTMDKVVKIQGEGAILDPESRKYMSRLMDYCETVSMAISALERDVKDIQRKSDRDNREEIFMK